MIEIGKLAGRETVCIVTDMNEPLGYAVGNNLEVIEAIKFLKGDMPSDLKEVVIELGAYMIKLADKGDDIEENKQKLLDNIKNGKSYDKFIELVKNQGGDISYIEDTEKFEKASIIKEVISNKEGNIQEINAKTIGEISCALGAGRQTKTDKIDLSVGIILNKKVGDYVKIGDIIATVYANDQEKANKAEEEILNTYKIGKEKEDKQTILEIIE